MSSVTVSLRRAEDLEYVERLLDRNDLPTSDVQSNPGTFYVAHDGDDRVGIGGLEVYGTDALLRSVVVEESARGDGFGSALCAALEREAREQGVETLYLLTTTAADFFAGRDYAEIDRTDPPERIQDTTEFDDLCPTSATCMQKSL